MLVATVLHDPGLNILDNVFAKMYKQHPFVTDDFKVILSQETPVGPYRELLGDKIKVQSKPSGLAGARREALAYFLETEHTHMLLADFDRLLYWLTFDRETFDVILDNKRGDYITIGRSEKAMQSHPEPQRSTERAINAYTFAALHPSRKIYDIVAGTYIMSQIVAHHIASNSFAVDPGAIDVEWFILASYWHYDKSTPFLSVDGLGYEGEWLGLEPEITPAIKRKRQLNLERAIAYVDTIKFWGGL